MPKGSDGDVSGVIQIQLHQSSFRVVGDHALVRRVSPSDALDLGRDEAGDPGDALDEGHLRVAYSDLFAEVPLGVRRNHAAENENVDVGDVVVVQDAVELIGGVREESFASQDLDGFDEDVRAPSDDEDSARSGVGRSSFDLLRGAREPRVLVRPMLATPTYMMLARPTSAYDPEVPANHHLPELAPARIAQRPTWLDSRVFVRSSRLLSAAFEAQGGGLRGYHYRLLAAIDEHGAASQADLGRSVSLDRSDVTAVLTELETRHLVERVVDPAHKRRKIVSLTPAGREQLLALDAIVDQTQEDFLAPLTRAQRRQFTDLLGRLLAAE